MPERYHCFMHTVNKKGDFGTTFDKKREDFGHPPDGSLPYLYLIWQFDIHQMASQFLKLVEIWWK